MTVPPDSQPPPRLASRLEGLRRKRFLGRDRELAALKELFVDGGPVLANIHAPGGVGKSSLLKEFQKDCAANGIAVHWVDGTKTDPSPEGFIACLQKMLNPEEFLQQNQSHYTPNPWSMEQLIDALYPGTSGKSVLIIDTFEHLKSLENWLRTAFLPNLLEGMSVVISGRTPLSAEWSTDLGWQSLITRIKLEPLTRAESLAFLSQFPFSESVKEKAQDLCLGHPFALALMADLLTQHPEVDLHETWTTEAIPALMTCFLATVPSTQHRAALYAACRVYILDEPLLGVLMDIEDAGPYYEWLSSLSFIENSPTGLCPHELAREVILEDMRQRNPQGLDDLTNMAKRHLWLLLKRPLNTQKYRQVMLNKGFLYLDHPVLWRVYRSYNRRYPSGSLLNAIENFNEEPMLPRDWGAFERGITDFEKEDSLLQARYWWNIQPAAFRVLRDKDKSIKAFFCTLRLYAKDGALMEKDPVAAEAWKWVQAYRPIKEKEYFFLTRFAFTPDEGHQVSPASIKICLQVVRGFGVVPPPAMSMVVSNTNREWDAVFSFGQFNCISEFDCAEEQRRLYMIDWREQPLETWMPELGLYTDLARGKGLPGEKELDRETYFEGVKKALSEVMNLAILAKNPLLDSFLVWARAGDNSSLEERAKSLQTLLRESTEKLGHGKTAIRGSRALLAAYFNPYKTHAEVAKELDIPLSSFMRHLREGTVELSEYLWREEREAIERSKNKNQ